MAAEPRLGGRPHLGWLVVAQHSFVESRDEAAMEQVANFKRDKRYPVVNYFESGSNKRAQTGVSIIMMVSTWHRANNKSHRRTPPHSHPHILYPSPAGFVYHR